MSLKNDHEMSVIIQFQRQIKHYRVGHAAGNIKNQTLQPDGRPPQPVRPQKSGRVHLAEGSNVGPSCFRIRNTFCRTQSLPNACNFYSFFDHVMKIGRFFTEIWRYIDFQNGGRTPSQNCFTTIRDHSLSPCCWPQLPVKFHVDLIHRSEDIAV